MIHGNMVPDGFQTAIGSVWILVLIGGAAPAAETVPAAESAILKQQVLTAWGSEALARIQKDLEQSGSSLYAEYGTPAGQRGSDHGRYAFVWPSALQLRALASAAKLMPQVYTRTMTGLADGLDQYWIQASGIAGFAVLPRGNERYYDDNACAALALVDAYDVTRKQKYLQRAVQALEFAASGENKTPGGGIRQHEDKEGRVSVCATAPAIVGALRLHRITRDRKYLPMAERWLAVILSKEAGVRDPGDGLFHELKEGKRAYLSAYVLEACLLFYQETKDEKHLGEAKRIANSALLQFVQPDGSLKETGQWGGSDLCDALLDLYEIDKDGRWQAAVHGMLRFLHEKCRDKDGRYGEYWNEDRSTQSLAKFHLLHMAPAARAYWHAAAVKTPPSSLPR